MITRKTPEQIDRMREAGRLVGHTLSTLVEAVRPGVTLLELDAQAERVIRDGGGIPSFLGYHGFPATLCLSPNDWIVHGIPNGYVLQEGDILSIDCGAIVEGWHGDAAVTVPVGQVDDAARRLIETTERALWAGIAQVGGQPPVRHRPRGREGRRRPRLRRGPRVRRSRHRHPHARGAPGPQLRPPRPRPPPGDRPRPGHRAHGQRGRPPPASWTTAGPSSPSTAPAPPTSSTPSPSPPKGPRSSPCSTEPARRTGCRRPHSDAEPAVAAVGRRAGCGVGRELRRQPQRDIHNLRGVGPGCRSLAVALAGSLTGEEAGMAGEVAFFELGVEDVERGRVFYEGLFGWRFETGPSGRVLDRGGAGSWRHPWRGQGGRAVPVLPGGGHGRGAPAGPGARRGGRGAECPG